MVKPHYKQTEIGVIPENWDVKQLKNVAPLQRGFDLPHAQIKLGKYPVAFSNGIGAFHSEFMAKGPGVVTGRSGTIGKVHFIESNYWPHNTSLWVTDFCGNDPLFIYYLFNTIQWDLYNAGSGVPTLNRNDVHEVLLAIPPKPEQEAIAVALSDIDALITNLEKLIAKKKAIKQGAMQELLTGKRRLPGFDGAWKKVRVDDICKFINGGTPSKSNTDWWNGTIPWISSSDIALNDIHSVSISRYITQDAIYHSATKLCPAGSVLVVSRVGVGKVAVSPCELCTSQDFTNLVPYGHNPHYLAYRLLKIMKEKAKQVQGTSIKGITVDDIANIEFLSPPEDEQLAIVTVLHEMDTGIELLIKKLAKASAMKSGMMSELLTGRIRLV